MVSFDFIPAVQYMMYFIYIFHSYLLERVVFFSYEGSFGILHVHCSYKLIHEDVCLK